MAPSSATFGLLGGYGLYNPYFGYGYPGVGYGYPGMGYGYPYAGNSAAVSNAFANSVYGECYNSFFCMDTHYFSCDLSQSMLLQ